MKNSCASWVALIAAFGAVVSILAPPSALADERATYSLLTGAKGTDFESMIIRAQDEGDGDFEFESSEGQVSIKEPGPDSADLPDSAFAVDPGVVYFETSMSYTSAKGVGVRDYFTATLIRIGLWEKLELRIASPGIIHEDSTADNRTGFGPLTFGFKRNIYDNEDQYGLPGFGIIAQVTVPTASAGFDDGTAVPTLFFNFDHNLPWDSYFEWNAGITAAHDVNGDRFTQGTFLWSFGHEFNECFTGFFHGIATFPARTGNDSEVVMGPGVIWFVRERFAIDSSYNFGVTDQSFHRFIRIGLSAAF